MPYAARALDLYNHIEGVIVNGQIPSRFNQNLMSAKNMQEMTKANGYELFEGPNNRKKGDTLTKEEEIKNIELAFEKHSMGLSVERKTEAVVLSLEHEESKESIEQQE